MLSVTLLSSASGAGAEYLFDALKRPPYLKSWSAMFKGEKSVPAWLSNYPKTGDGPTSPCKPLRIDGAEYKIHTVCKTHDCGNNIFVVAFAPEGLQAWGFLLTDSDSKRYFGNPDEKLKDALVQADCE